MVLVIEDDKQYSLGCNAPQANETPGRLIKQSVVEDDEQNAQGCCSPSASVCKLG